MTDTIDLRAGDYQLVLEPERGGSIARFDWRREPLLRATNGPSILDVACFPLVPFSNRIARGRFVWEGQAVAIAPNFPGADPVHPLHGFGWLGAWQVIERTATRAVLRHTHEAGEWPWRYVAEQTFELGAAGLSHALSLRNMGATAMPAGLGFHPYFPRTGQTRYLGLHRGEWQASTESLPLALHDAGRPIDWWQGQPVGSRAVDTAYTDRAGPLVVTWPERALALTITPCDLLALTVVFSPAGADFVCIEPVSNATDALNRAGAGGAMQRLGAGETLSVDMHYRADRLPR